MGPALLLLLEADTGRDLLQQLRHGAVGRLCSDQTLAAHVGGQRVFCSPTTSPFAMPWAGSWLPVLPVSSGIWHASQNSHRIFNTFLIRRMLPPLPFCALLSFPASHVLCVGPPPPPTQSYIIPLTLASLPLPRRSLVLGSRPH